MLTCACWTSESIIGGNLRCPWYFLLAYAASAPDSPISYAEMNLADLFCSSKFRSESVLHLNNVGGLCGVMVTKFCSSPILLDKVQLTVVFRVKIPRHGDSLKV